MKMSMLRPIMFKVMNSLLNTLRGKQSVVVLGRRVRFARACEVEIGKNAIAHFGDDVKLRSGCILQIAKNAQIELAESVEVRSYAIIECGGKVKVGRRSIIGAYNWLQGSGVITIGDDVIIGPGVRIISTTHDLSDAKRSFAEQSLISGEIFIGNNVWIGANAIILTGVNIGNNVVIGAGSLVNKSLAANGVYAGVPSRRIKDVVSDQ